MNFLALNGTDSNLKGDYCVIQPIFHQESSMPHPPPCPKLCRVERSILEAFSLKSSDTTVLKARFWSSSLKIIPLPYILHRVEVPVTHTTRRPFAVALFTTMPAHAHAYCVTTAYVVMRKCERSL